MFAGAAIAVEGLALGFKIELTLFEFFQLWRKLVMLLGEGVFLVDVLNDLIFEFQTRVFDLLTLLGQFDFDLFKSALGGFDPDHLVANLARSAIEELEIFL